MRGREKMIVMGAASILLVPLVAMQFTDEVAWTLADFVVGGILLVGAALAYVFAARQLPSRRLAIGLGVTAVLVLVWLELAVGLFGTPFGGS
jgi:hypothetical protein